MKSLRIPRRYPTIIIWANSLKVHLVASRHVDLRIHSTPARRNGKLEWAYESSLRVLFISNWPRGSLFCRGRILGDRFLPIASPFLAGGRNDYRRRSDFSRIVHSSTSTSFCQYIYNMYISPLKQWTHVIAIGVLLTFVSYHVETRFLRSLDIPGSFKVID